MNTLKQIPNPTLSLIEDALKSYHDCEYTLEDEDISNLKEIIEFWFKKNVLKVTFEEQSRSLLAVDKLISIFNNENKNDTDFFELWVVLNLLYKPELLIRLQYHIKKLNYIKDEINNTNNNVNINDGMCFELLHYFDLTDYKDIFYVHRTNDEDDFYIINKHLIYESLKNWNWFVLMNTEENLNTHIIKCMIFQVLMKLGNVLFT